VSPSSHRHTPLFAVAAVSSSYMSIRDDFMESVRTVRTRYPDSDVVLTGHSLGGALAYVAAVDLAVNEGITVTHSYTFGQPRSDDTHGGRQHAAGKDTPAQVGDACEICGLIFRRPFPLCVCAQRGQLCVQGHLGSPVPGDRHLLPRYAQPRPRGT